MEEDFETAPPKKPRTEAQKKATENMLMKLKEKRKQAEEALEEVKKVKEKAKEIRKEEIKKAGRPVGIPRSEEKIMERPVSSATEINYDELAQRLSEKMQVKKKKKVVVEVSSDDSSSSSEEEVIVKKRTTKKTVKTPRTHEPAYEEPQPMPSTGSRVLDSLFYSRR